MQAGMHKYSKRATDMKKIVLVAMALSVLLGFSITSKAQGLTQIDSTTFSRNTKVTTVHIGSDVDEITSGAFRSLGNLREITVSENNPFYTSYSGCLYDKAMTELLCYPPDLPGAIIPSTVVSIRTNALHGVPGKLKNQIIDVIQTQAQGNLPESQIQGEHFVHTENGIKWKQADGSIVSPDSNLKYLAASVVGLSSSGDMTQLQQLEAAFNYVASNIYYVRSTEVPEGEWAKEYASKTLSTGAGNCYGYAAAFAYVAKGLGYNSRVCTGTVASALGGRTDHAWTEVKIGKAWYIFDTEMQRAKGSGYYKQTYESYPAGPIEKKTSQSVSFD